LRLRPATRSPRSGATVHRGIPDAQPEKAALFAGSTAASPPGALKRDAARSKACVRRFNSSPSSVVDAFAQLGNSDSAGTLRSEPLVCFAPFCTRAGNVYLGALLLTDISAAPSESTLRSATPWYPCTVPNLFGRLIWLVLALRDRRLLVPGSPAKLRGLVSKLN